MVKRREVKERWMVLCEMGKGKGRREGGIKKEREKVLEVEGRGEALVGRRGIREKEGGVGRGLSDSDEME